METQSRKNKVVFPIIEDDKVLIPDNRVIMKNQELLTRNPDISVGQVAMSTPSQVDNQGMVTSETESEMTFETRRQMPTTAGKRPLGKVNVTYQNSPTKKKSSVVEEARKRARENAVQPKPIKSYVSPLAKASAEDLGIKGLANKKVAKTQRSLGQSVSSFDKNLAHKANREQFTENDHDYFASKHQQHEHIDAVK